MVDRRPGRAGEAAAGVTAQTQENKLGIVARGVRGEGPLGWLLRPGPLTRLGDKILDTSLGKTYPSTGSATEIYQSARNAKNRQPVAA